MKFQALGSMLLSVTAIVASIPAQATGTLIRTFVSSAGVDSNPCTVAQPCASFAAAYAAVQNNGIVAALDPGKYGPLTNITTGVTINGNGWAAITAPAGGNGVTINAGSGNVTLIGLQIDGTQAAYNGIVDNSAGSLTIADCTLRNFIPDSSFHANTGNGILLQPASGAFDFTITNTKMSNLGEAGIVYMSSSGSPSAYGIIDHVMVTNAYFGFSITTAGNATTVVNVSNSIASHDNVGISLVNSGPSSMLDVAIDNVNASDNDTGVFATGTPSVLLSRSIIAGNVGNGVQNNTSPNTFYSYKDNRINLNGANFNGTDITIPFNTSFSQQ